MASETPARRALRSRVSGQVGCHRAPRRRRCHGGPPTRGFRSCLPDAGADVSASSPPGGGAAGRSASITCAKSSNLPANPAPSAWNGARCQDRRPGTLWAIGAHGFALSIRCGGQQIDVAVELPKGIRHVTRRGADLEEAVDVGWPVTVGDVPPVWGDVELIDGRTRCRGAREVPLDDASPVVARSDIVDAGTALVAGGA